MALRAGRAHGSALIRVVRRGVNDNRQGVRVAGQTRTNTSEAFNYAVTNKLLRGSRRRSDGIELRR
jgi:hypothetical protein